MAKEIAAGFIVYRRAEGGLKFLLLYDRGRDWNFPRGKLVAQEKSFLGAIRETEEETGLGRKDLRIKRRFRAYERFTFLSRDKEKIYKTIIFYLAETNKKQIKLSHEHDGFGWFLYKDATKMLSSYKERGAVLKKANSFILQLEDSSYRKLHPNQTHQGSSRNKRRHSRQSHRKP